MIKRILMLSMILFCTLLAISHSVHISAESYNYDYWEQPRPTKNGYKVQQIIYGENIDLTVPDDTERVTVKHFTDLFVRDYYYYVVDRQASRVAKLDKHYNTVHVFTGIDIETPEGPVFESFLEPRSIFVTDDSEYYITDYERQAIYVFDENYAFVKKITQPDNPTYGDRPFAANKIVLDRTKRIYVTVGNVYDGIVEMNNDGDFSRFFGVQQVAVNPLDILWRRFMTETQLQRTVLFLPVEYTNMAIDQDGFIYATATSESQTPIQRLNPNGNDVLRRNGYIQPIGDVIKYPNQPRSNFVSIAINTYGMYSVLDRATRKVFTYNEQGYLIYVTGGDGNLEGMFRSPTSIVYDDELMLVGDSALNTITVFSPTEFGRKVNEALRLTYYGEYLNISELWEGIVEENVNFSYAYIGIGDNLFRQKCYDEAMEAYRLGHDRIGYSKAYEQYRKNVLRDNFGYLGMTATIVIFFTIVRPIFKDIRRGGDNQ